MDPTPERVDEQLVSLHVQLQKLNILVEHLCQHAGTRRKRELLDTIQHHREALIGASRTINERIETMCRTGG
jgi:hypothetical protein